MLVMKKNRLLTQLAEMHARYARQRYGKLQCTQCTVHAVASLICAAVCMHKHAVVMYWGVSILN